MARQAISRSMSFAIGVTSNTPVVVEPPPKRTRGRLSACDTPKPSTSGRRSAVHMSTSRIIPSLAFSRCAAR